MGRRVREPHAKSGRGFYPPGSKRVKRGARAARRPMSARLLPRHAVLLDPGLLGGAARVAWMAAPRGVLEMPAHDARQPVVEARRREAPVSDRAPRIRQ